MLSGVNLDDCPSLVHSPQASGEAHQQLAWEHNSFSKQGETGCKNSQVAQVPSSQRGQVEVTHINVGVKQEQGEFLRLLDFGTLMSLASGKTTN